MKKYTNVQRLTLSALFLALCMLFPFVTGQVPKIGNMLCPMHIPVLLCGFLCGWQYGAVVGFLAPLLRSMIFGMPVIFPMGISMAFELLTYGVVSGIVYQKLPEKKGSVFLSLVSAMLAGRVVWGLARFVLALLFELEFPFSMFISGAFLTAVPGMILQLVVIPLLVGLAERMQEKQ